MKRTAVLMLLLAASTSFADEKPVHVFILSGQSNMAGMDPESLRMIETYNTASQSRIMRKTE